MYLFPSTITLFTLLQPFSLPYYFISSLLQSFSLPYLFISPLPSTLISFFLFLFVFLYFCLYLFTPFYYKFVTIFSILCIIFPHKKKKGPLSLSFNFLVDFFIFLSSLLQVDYFLYSLKLYFGLMQFSLVFKIVIQFCFLNCCCCCCCFFFFFSLIVICYPIAF